MSKKAEAPAPTHNTEGSGGGSNIKMFIIFGAIGLIMMLASVGGTLYFTGFFNPNPGGHGEATTQHEEEKKVDFSKLPPNYLEIKPGFVANAIEDDNLHFILAEISLMSKNPEAIDKIVANLMGIRDGIREALSGHLYTEVLGFTGIEKLRAAAETAVNDYLEHRHLPKIDALYFNSFVVQ